MKPEKLLTPELLLQGYASGIFPMAESRDDPEIFWVDPRLRGIIPLDGLHVSRSLRRRLRAEPFFVTINQDFDGVVSGCADRDETWISDTIFDLYRALHLARYAHSIELWQGNRLVGGVYGVALGAAFFGESMFSRQPDASKIALVYLVDRLRLGGFTLFDTQFVTPHLATMGGIEVPRAEYHRKLGHALEGRGDFNAAPAMPPIDQVLQRIAQRS